MSKNTLIIITQSYPYSIAVEETFIEPELKYLSEVFDKIIFLPQNAGGYLREIPYSNVTFDDSFIHLIYSGTKIKKVLNIVYYFLFNFISIFRNIKNNEIALNKNTVSYFLNCIYYSYLFEKKKDLILNSLVYCYWADFSIVGLSFLKLKYNNIKFISRCHGIDVFAERNNMSFFPFRYFAIQSMNNFYFSSNSAENYVKLRYKKFINKYIVASLGTFNHNNITNYSEDNSIRIVSCSYLVAVKRLPLLIKSLSLVAHKNINTKFIWTHFGGGDLFNELYELSKSIFPSNLEFKFLGNKDNSEIYDFYRDSKVDFFITTSQSEGGRPISSMEALSFGIPIVATDVGGIPELVINNETGVTFSAESNEDEISNLIDNFIKNKMHIKLRDNAKKYWSENLNTKKNAINFINTLLII